MKKSMGNMNEKTWNSAGVLPEELLAHLFNMY